MDPGANPTAAFVRPQVGYSVGTPGQQLGFGFEIVTRETYYRETHLQTIAFEITREVTRRLTDTAHPGSEGLRTAGRSTLFPQVLRYTQIYLATRVKVNGCHPCEVGLQVYAQRIVDLLVAAIHPDDERGEPHLLPRLNRYRAIGSSAAVRFKTVKPVVATHASHLNFVAADTNSWEQAAALQLEMAAQGGIVSCYVRNDRLELTIPYEFYGQPRAYEPDFVVRMSADTHLLLEVKGAEPAEVPAKHEAAARWVRAVNRWGQLGRWDFMVCHDPQQIRSMLARRISQPSNARPEAWRAIPP